MAVAVFVVIVAFVILVEVSSEINSITITIVCCGDDSWVATVRGGVSLIFPPKSVLIVMHPNLENSLVYPDFIAEICDQLFVSLLHLPPNSLCEFQHFILLILGEFCPESLAAIWVYPASSCGVASRGHGQVAVLWGTRQACTESKEHVCRGIVRGGDRWRRWGTGATVATATTVRGRVSGRR